MKYCIYRITNLINGKTYIGQHKYETLDDNYMGSGKHLKAAQAKYGIENFKKEILVYNVSTQEHIDLLEKTFITSEREKVGVENCYNITDGGYGGNGSLNKGKIRSEETKMKISKANKGKIRSEEMKKKISKANKGRVRTKEARKKISEAMKGNSKALGHHFKPSEETRKKISEVTKGKKRSEETRKKISEVVKGRFKGMHWKLVEGHRVWLKEENI